MTSDERKQFKGTVVNTQNVGSMPPGGFDLMSSGKVSITEYGSTTTDSILLSGNMFTIFHRSEYNFKEFKWESTCTITEHNCSDIKLWNVYAGDKTPVLMPDDKECYCRGSDYYDYNVGFYAGSGEFVSWGVECDLSVRKSRYGTLPVSSVEFSNGAQIKKDLCKKFKYLFWKISEFDIGFIYLPARSLYNCK